MGGSRGSQRKRCQKRGWFRESKGATHVCLAAAAGPAAAATTVPPLPLQQQHSSPSRSCSRCGAPTLAGAAAAATTAAASRGGRRRRSASGLGGAARPWVERGSASVGWAGQRAGDRALRGTGVRTVPGAVVDGGGSILLVIF